MRGEIGDITYFSKESGFSSIPNTFDRNDDFHFSNNDRLKEIGDYSGKVIQLFRDVKESRNFLMQDKLFSKVAGIDRVFISSDNLIDANRDFSAFACLLKSLCNNINLSGSDKTGRRELSKKQKQGCTKDITDLLQFRQGTQYNPFNFVFSRSDEISDGFSFYGNIPEVFGVLRKGRLHDRIFLKHKKFGDSKGIFIIGFGLTQRQLRKIKDKKGINYNGIDSFIKMQREDIDMVGTCGFHACQDNGEVFAFISNGIHNHEKPAFIHRGGKRKTDIVFASKTCGVEIILGYIYADKNFAHKTTSVTDLLDKVGKVSRPILRNDKDSKIQSTYNGYGSRGTDFSEYSMTQIKWSYPTYPTLTCKTSFYKFYNTNSY